jgi:hypothetical protein
MQCLRRLTSREIPHQTNQHAGDVLQQQFNGESITEPSPNTNVSDITTIMLMMFASSKFLSTLE